MKFKTLEYEKKEDEKIQKELNLIFNKLNIKDKEIKEYIIDYFLTYRNLKLNNFLLDLIIEKEDIKSKKDIEKYFILFKVFIKKSNNIKYYPQLKKLIKSYILKNEFYNEYLYLIEITKKIYFFNKIYNFKITNNNFKNEYNKLYNLLHK